MKNSKDIATDTLTEIINLGIGDDNMHRKLIAKSIIASTLSSNELNASLQILTGTVSEVGKDIKKSTTQIIASNEELNKSNEKYSNWIKWLTVALVIIGIAQVIVPIIYNIKNANSLSSIQK